jgi:hypothetical protein
MQFAAAPASDEARTILDRAIRKPFINIILDP